MRGRPRQFWYPGAGARHRTARITTPARALFRPARRELCSVRRLRRAVLSRRIDRQFLGLLLSGTCRGQPAAVVRTKHARRTPVRTLRPRHPSGGALLT